MTVTGQRAKQSNRGRPGAGGISRRAVLAGAALSGAVAAACGRPVSAAPAAHAAPRLIVRGVSLPSWWNGTYAASGYAENLTAMRGLGFNAVAIVPCHVLASATDSRVLASEQSERLDNVARALERARSEGLQVLLRPHLTVADHAVPSSAIDPGDKATFFDSYQALIDDYARLAARAGSTFLVVGGGLPHLTKPSSRESWQRVIATARQAFSGPLVYAAGRGEEQHVPFWDDLDYIGIDLHLAVSADQPMTAETIFRLSDKARPIVDANNVPFADTSFLDGLQAMSRAYRKPVLFTDVGVRRVGVGQGGGSRRAANYLAADVAPQLTLGEALLRQASDEGDGWLAGMVLSGWRFDAATNRDAWA